MSFRNFIPTVWSAQMLKSLKNDNVAVRLSDARYRSDAKYGEEIKINGVGKVNIRDYVKGEPLTRDGWEDQSTLIKIDQQKYFNFGVDDIDKRQAQGDLMAPSGRKPTWPSLRPPTAMCTASIPKRARWWSRRA